MRAEIEEMEARMDPEYDGRSYEPEPWEEWFHDEKVKGEMRLRRIETMGKIYTLGKQALVEYGLVILVGLTAVVSPTTVTTLLDWLQT